ncbi:MAG TPA: cytochrome c biogenesis protein ResB [Syntrophorhabdaceae bacterium]|nr:cytochrome c biogenesis protein ResB [Syntrophorhabdaceae bacterium]
MTATKSNSGTETPPASRAASLSRSLASVRLGIVVLSLIAATSILGSVIKQGGTEEEYLSLYSEKAYHFIKLFGFDDAYHSPWFYFLLALFALNLIACTVRRIRGLTGERGPGAKNAPDVKALAAAGSGFSAPVDTLGEISRRLSASSYKRKQLSERTTLYEKGSLARYGVLVIHASVLIVLLGGLIGLVAGDRGFLVLRVGETAEAAVSRERARLPVPLGFTVRCKDFNVTFYPGGQPKEYASDIEILDGAGKVLKEGRIKVNEPLSYNGVRLYQSSYGTSNSYTFRVDGREVVLAEQEVAKAGRTAFMVVRYAPQVHDFGPGVMVAYMDGEEPKTLWFLRDVERMRTRVIEGSRISLEGITGGYYTGLEVSRDPGVPVVLAGFALMLVGLYINFFTFHRRIYVVSDGAEIHVGGVAARNREGFLEELRRLSKDLA